MTHFIAIQSALKPEEAALARQLAAELSPVELRAWFDELSRLSGDLQRWLTDAHLEWIVNLG